MDERTPLATPEQVSEYLNVRPRTLEYWRYRGRGPKSRPVGRTVRYAWADVDEWLNAQRASNGRRGVA